MSPQIIGFEHPFPFLENGSEYLILELEKNKSQRFEIMVLPNILPKTVKLLSSTGYPYIRPSKVINCYDKECYPKSKICSKMIIRIRKNADLSADDEMVYNDLYYRDYVKKILKKRNRLQTVRLEVNEKGIKPFKKLLCSALNISFYQNFESEVPLFMDYVEELKSYLPEILFSNNEIPRH